MDVEERARRTVALLPPAGPLRRAMSAHPRLSSGAFYVWLLAGMWAFWTYETSWVVSVVSIVGSLSFSLLVFDVGRLQTRARDLAAADDVDGASRVLFEAVQRRLLLPEWRSSLALALASHAMVAGHADRAIVLVRAIEEHAALRHRERSALLHLKVLSLLALGRSDDARTLIHSALRGQPLARRRDHVGIALTVEALTGSVDAALGCLRELDSQPPQSPKLQDAYYRAQRAFRSLLAAYIWDRALAEQSEESRTDAETARATALASAVGVPRTFYTYLKDVSPDFVAFAERAREGARA